MPLPGEYRNPLTKLDTKYHGTPDGQNKCKYAPTEYTPVIYSYTYTSNPTKTCKYSYPTKSCHYSNPAQSCQYSNPTKSCKYSYPTKSSHYSNPTKSCQYSNATKSCHYSNPTKSCQYSNPTKSSQFSNPTKFCQYSNLQNTKIVIKSLQMLKMGAVLTIAYDLVSVNDRSY